MCEVSTSFFLGAGDGTGMGTIKKLECVTGVAVRYRGDEPFVRQWVPSRGACMQLQKTHVGCYTGVAGV